MPDFLSSSFIICFRSSSLISGGTRGGCLKRRIYFSDPQLRREQSSVFLWHQSESEVALYFFRPFFDALWYFLWWLVGWYFSFLITKIDWYLWNGIQTYIVSCLPFYLSLPSSFFWLVIRIDRWVSTDSFRFFSCLYC